MKKILFLALLVLIVVISGCGEVAVDKTSCLLDSDCACGSWLTGGCAVGNKQFIDVSKQCPDFCTGIANNFETKCVNKVCELVQKAVQKTGEQACTNSGGTIGESSCCLSSGDFPNTCLIGACGCSPSNSHAVKVCNCPEGKCWDGNECVGSAPPAQEEECASDSDCAPSECCHPDQCVPIDQKPDCSGIMCTAVCEPGTLDCGQGECVCDEGFCKAVITTTD